jgi:hypothetical protein
MEEFFMISFSVNYCCCCCCCYYYYYLQSLHVHAKPISPGIVTEYNGTVHQLFTDFERPYDSGKREALYIVLLEFLIPKKLVRLIKMCLNETYSKVRVGKFLSGTFPIQIGLKQRDALPPLLFYFALEYAIRKVQENLVSL